MFHLLFVSENNTTNSLTVFSPVYEFAAQPGSGFTQVSAVLYKRVRTDGPMTRLIMNIYTWS